MPDNRLSSPSELLAPLRRLVWQMLGTIRAIDEAIKQGKEIVERNQSADRKQYPPPYQKKEEQ